MKNILPVLSALLLAAISARAQTTDIVKVEGGNDLAPAVSKYGIYRFPAFTSGTFFLKDGTYGKEIFNYNILAGQIMYLDGKGDTMTISFPEKIKKIDINGIAFYYEKNNWFESIADGTEASLVIKRRVVVNFEKKGPLGVSSTSGSGIQSFSSFASDNKSYQLHIDDDASVAKTTSYFLMTGEGRFLSATKGNFLTLFTKNKKDLESYLNNNKVNFNKEADLLQLMNLSGAADRKKSLQPPTSLQSL